MGKNQEIDIFLCAHCHIKNLSWEILIKLIKGKECNVMHLNGIVYRGSPLEPCKSLSLLIPMPLTHLSNIARGNDFVNKSAWLSKKLFAINSSHHYLKVGVHKIIKSDITQVIQCICYFLKLKS
jgi:hypothetical protein